MDPHQIAIQAARAASFAALQASAVAHMLLLDDAYPRKKSKFHERAKWEKFVSMHKDRPFFRRHLRMGYDSFCFLLEKIKPFINIDEDMGSLRGGSISLELHLYATLRYLAGGSYSDICSTG